MTTMIWKRKGVLYFGARCRAGVTPAALRHEATMQGVALEPSVLLTEGPDGNAYTAFVVRPGGTLR